MSVVSPSWLELLEGEELAHVAVEPPRAGTTEPFPDELDPRVAIGARRPGDHALYAHQAEAWEALREASNVIVTTSTASGKTPRLQPAGARPARARAEEPGALPLPDEGARAGPGARALGASASRGCKPAIYDGDTESERRWQIRKWANVILTNPDMLHVGVLPHHDRWGDVLANLRYVVVDEAHVYRGVFGSHVAQRPPPPAPARPRVRLGAAVPARIGDDREPGRARGVAARRARRP